MRQTLAIIFLFGLLNVSGSIFAGPPFLTDDPEPIEYKHTEMYLFTTLDRADDATVRQAPAYEVNYGPAPDWHLHLVVPYTGFIPKNGDRNSGVGDTEFGFKYRFVQETDKSPQMGTFPLFEISTGDADKGLGNGKNWVKLPIWAQKSWEPWTTYGGVGYAVNPAAGQRNYLYAGWLVQRDFGEHLTLGAELFTQGKTADGGQATTFANFGGFLNLSKNISILFSAGHNISGEKHLISYLALYWTW